MAPATIPGGENLENLPNLYQNTIKDIYHHTSFLMLVMLPIKRGLGGFYPKLIRHASSKSMDAIVNLCKHRGFIYPSSEIYSPYSGFFDYGPLGTEMKRNIKREWWTEFVQKREDVVGIDCSIISNPAIWHASGHTKNFCDPMVDCRDSGLRFRADQVYWAILQPESGTDLIYVSVLEGDDMHEQALKKAKKLAKKQGISGPFLPLSELKDLTQCTDAEVYVNIPSPATGTPGVLTMPREFNLMFQTNVGAVKDDSAVSYLRPETAQGIFTNFANVQRTSRMKIPFGIAQIGKAFRNEITPRNFIFRSREFELMEIEYFVSDIENKWEQYYDEWIRDSWNWLCYLGLDTGSMHKDVKGPGDLAHYARACTDITFDFPFGNQELMGIAARGDYDLQTHSEGSGETLHYFDSTDGRRFVPHCIEPSVGIDRLLLALLSSAYHQEMVEGSNGKSETRTVLKLHPRIAPVKAVILPLVNNKPELTEKARELFRDIQSKFMCEYDTSGTIGKRYRRADEVGTPFCITVDFDTVDGDTVTIRRRDSMEQVRIASNEVLTFLSREIENV